MDGIKYSLALIGALAFFANFSATPATFSLSPSNVKPPNPNREFRGAWLATVANIDWPSKPGLTSQQQQTELAGILDRASQLHLNAVVMQVRPACDALYSSKLEPWSEYLSGTMGQAPEPFYDPLEFAVAEAHKRGIELHAWFNPYRAHHELAKSPISADHISKTKPYLVRPYGKSLWLDPGEKEVQDYSVKVIIDVVKRYDIDGVHIDDYFYPYRERGADNKEIDFPDDHSWIEYVKQNVLDKNKKRKMLSRDDWRRSNVNAFVERLYKEVRKEKAWVKVGISPFGIWRPGNPSSIKGFDAYQEIYADSKLWLNQGWLDYCSPQLYWRTTQANLSYKELLKWWASQNKKNRHLWPGNYTSQTIAEVKPWPASEITHQIDLTRQQPGATGNIHFSIKTLMSENTNLSAQLEHDSYNQMSLVPASDWLKREHLDKPKLQLQKDPVSGDPILQWSNSGRGKVWLWVVQTLTDKDWQTVILPALQTACSLKPSDSRSPMPSNVSVRPVDRCGNLGPEVVMEIKSDEEFRKQGLISAEEKRAKELANEKKIGEKKPFDKADQAAKIKSLEERLGVKPENDKSVKTSKESSDRSGDAQTPPALPKPVKKP